MNMNIKAPSCPRCDSTQTKKVADSPVKGRAEVYRCPDCNYVWRSTEDLAGIAKNIAYLREHATTDEA